MSNVNEEKGNTIHPLNSDARRLLYDLVSTPSLSGEEDAVAQQLVEFFRERGRDVWLDEVGNVRAPGNDALLLTSHLDTVPGDIPVEITDDILWGRGSVDAKGSLATMAVAAAKTGVSFVGVVEEETSSQGAHYLMADRDTPGAVINGEPSGWDGITLGYRGLIKGTYINTSEAGHSSRPESNAIEDAITWWDRVEDAFDPDSWTPVFEQVTPKPVRFDGGTSEAGFSMEATMETQFRIPPSMSGDDIRNITENELTNGSIRWEQPIPPVMKSPRTEIARAFRAAIREVGGEPRQLRKSGTSDMNIFATEWDCPMITYGPGDSDLDHTPNEHLSLDEFDKAVEVLTVVSDELASSHR
jgi:LysW-gamma-L-lysine carboxypeptidase